MYCVQNNGPLLRGFDGPSALAKRTNNTLYLITENHRRKNRFLLPPPCIAYPLRLFKFQIGAMTTVAQTGLCKRKGFKYKLNCKFLNILCQDCCSHLILCLEKMTNVIFLLQQILKLMKFSYISINSNTFVKLIL